MKKLFYIGIIGLILFEIANVYFIMPIPGSQRMNSIDAAYFLHTWRWVFRSILGLMIVFGAVIEYRKLFLSLKAPFGGLGALLLVAVIYATNFEMAADAMFSQPSDLQFKNAEDNKVGRDRLVIGAEINGQARAYPIQFLGYHHQVQDTLGGKSIIVTYCTVCRTGRVFEPFVNGKKETFRLVGMDHFNAMFEDNTTGSWWRQANGEAITGKLKGQKLPEIEITQTTLQKWLELYPNSLVMQPDLKFQEEYDSLSNYENGKRKGKLTRRDSLSWKDKSWIVGIEFNGQSKAFDWNRLEKQKIVNDAVGNQPIVLVLANDKKSFFAFKRPAATVVFSVKNDTLYQDKQAFDLLGRAVGSAAPPLTRINAYQEYWHSWQAFHPHTRK
jgi:hypothetical protein